MFLTLEIVASHVSDGLFGAEARKSFGPDGGIIGREADGSGWLLPALQVSREHARISYAGGTFYIEDRSSAGIGLNDPSQRLPKRQPHPLRSGDRLFIEPYEIVVSVSKDGQVPAARVEWSATDDGRPYVSGAAPAPVDTGASRVRQREAPPASAQSNGLPAVLAGLLRDSEPGNQESSLLDKGGRRHPLSPPPEDLENGGRLVTVSDSPVAADVVSEDDRIAQSFIRAEREARERAERAKGHSQPERQSAQANRDGEPVWGEIPTVPTAEATATSRVALSGIDGGRLGGAAEIPTAADPVPRVGVAIPGEDGDEDQRTAAAKAGAFQPSVNTSELGPRPKDDNRHLKASSSGAPAVPPPPPPSSGPLDQEFARRVLAAAGLDGVQATPELADTLGRVVQAAVAGVMNVMLVRYKTKHEFRIPGTRFAPVENNPLKFSVNADDALHNLFVKRNKAYLRPVDALSDAFADISHHELAVIKAMGDAVVSMVASFDPQAVEAEVDGQSGKGTFNLRPAGVRYWDAYKDTFQRLSADPEAQFKTLFGDAFARAYEKELERLRSMRRPNPSHE